MEPTAELTHEHKVIGLVVEAAERESRRIEQSGQVRPEVVEKMLDFFGNFTDRCHHAKEERHLFPLLRQRGLPAEGGPVAVMLAEHQEGRQRLAAIKAALPQAARGDGAARQAVRENLAAYAALLRAHIDKENGVLFPLAGRVLSAEDQGALSAAFERVEAEEVGEGVHERYHRLAHELAGRD